MALHKQLGFFDFAHRYEALSHQGDPIRTPHPAYPLSPLSETAGKILASLQAGEGQRAGL